MSAESPDLAPTQPQCMSDGQKAQLATKYGIQLSLAVNVKVPAGCEDQGCILDQDTVSKMLLLSSVTQNGQSLMLQTQPCHFEVPAVQLKGQPPTKLTPPDTLVQGVSFAPATAMLDGPNTCAKFTVPPFVLVLGASLTNPASDPLPLFKMGSVKLCDGDVSARCDTTKDTGCICDLDGDHEPGATVAASGVPFNPDIDQVYLALRSSVSLDATVWPASASQTTPGPQWKGAASRLKLDQSPVGCRHTVADDGGASSDGGTHYEDCPADLVNSIAGLNPQLTQSMNKGSTFVAVPVPDAETCEDLLRDAQTLFRNP